MIKYDFCDNWIVSNVTGRHSNEEIWHRNVVLPYDITIRTKRNPSSKGASHSGYWDGGEYRYTKRFFVSSEDRDKLMMLEFEGIYANASVYINGNHCANCPNGYTNYYVNLNGYIEYDAENELVVLLKTGNMPNSRWYTGTGIYRPVYLYKADRLHIPENGVRIVTENIYGTDATFSVSTRIQNFYDTIHSFSLLTTVFDDRGNMVARENTASSILADSESAILQRFNIHNANLWDEYSPRLYKVVSEIFENDVQKDIHETTTGLRVLSLNAQAGLRVNGNTIKLRGACIHHSSGFIGADTFDCEEERKVRLLKEAGFNAIRIAHQPCSKAMLNACDKLGMYVMEESFDQWNSCKTQYDPATNFSVNWEYDVEAFVNKDFNHPSVIMYSIGNEINDIATKEGVAWAYRISEKIRRMDMTRYITNAINGMLCIMGNPKWINELKIDHSKDVNEIMDSLHAPETISLPGFTKSFEDSVSVLDIIGYNYMSPRYDIDCPSNQNRVYVGSETFAKDIGYNWDRVQKYSNLIGDFTWTGMEYLGEAGLARHDYINDPFAPKDFYGKYPHYQSGTGDITLVGDRLPISYYREIVFGLRKDPYIAVWNPALQVKAHSTSVWGWSDTVHYWRWPGFEGHRIVIEVYSNATEVELLLNGESIGRAKVTNYKCEFETEYAPGELVAINYCENIETGRQVLRTASDSLQISAQLDHDSLSVGGKDLAHLSITLHDDHGNLRIDDDRYVNITVEGVGELIGIGTADPLYTGDSFMVMQSTYRGRMLAYIRSGCEPGTIKVVVSSEGLGRKEFLISVQ